MHGRSFRRVRAYIGLGANLGDAAGTLASAIGALDRLPGVRVRSVSRLYVTAPWGVADQPEFRNAVAALDVRIPEAEAPETAALSLLTQLKEIERAAGRRPGRRWGPRVLDLDLLVFGRHRIRVARTSGAHSTESGGDPARATRLLEVPHPDASERLFVLAPLADLAPGLVPPGWPVTVGGRRRAVAGAEPPGSVRAVASWDPVPARWSNDRGRPTLGPVQPAGGSPTSGSPRSGVETA